MTRCHTSFNDGNTAAPLYQLFISLSRRLLLRLAASLMTGVSSTHGVVYPKGERSSDPELSAVPIQHPSRPPESPPRAAPTPLGGSPPSIEGFDRQTATSGGAPSHSIGPRNTAGAGLEIEQSNVRRLMIRRTRSGRHTSIWHLTLRTTVVYPKGERSSDPELSAVPIQHMGQNAILCDTQFRPVKPSQESITHVKAMATPNAYCLDFVAHLFDISGLTACATLPGHRRKMLPPRVAGQELRPGQLEH